MASERLTDSELDEAFDYARGSLRLTAALSELRERRAADLSADEREALTIVSSVVTRMSPGWIGSDTAARVTTVLDRMLASDSTAVILADDSGSARRVFLSGNEVEALDWARDIVTDRIKERRALGGLTMHSENALAALDKILATAVRK